MKGLFQTDATAPGSVPGTTVNPAGFVNPRWRSTLVVRTLLLMAMATVGLAACDSTVNETIAPVATFQASALTAPAETGLSAAPKIKPAATKAPAGASKACLPTDQDRYVYHPARLAVKTACLRVSGVIDAIRREADGDLHILLRLDAPYRHLLQPANAGEELGDLVVEPICVHTVSQSDAVAPCAADPDPLQNLPHTGMRVWIEGRYVLDLDHGGWAELHPLYRWGRAGGSTGGATTTAAPTPRPTTATSDGYYKPPGWDGVSDVNCSDFSTHAQAESFFLGTGGSRSYDLYGLDRDHDGLACESLP